MSEKAKQNTELPVIGLTGGIGTGKSTVAEFFKKENYAHVDADQIGRDLAAEGSELLPILNNVFGPSGALGEAGRPILCDDGSLDRKSLGAIVFAHQEKKQKLDEIMLSHIITEIDLQIAALRTCRNAENDNIPGIIIDAPLLFEAGLDDRCDTILLVTADLDSRIQRVCLRDGISHQDVRDRISCQMNEDEKKKRADIIIDNSGNLEELQMQLEQVFLQLCAKQGNISLTK